MQKDKKTDVCTPVIEVNLSHYKKLLNDKNLSVSKVKEEIAELIESVEKNTNKRGTEKTTKIP